MENKARYPQEEDVSRIETKTQERVNEEFDFEEIEVKEINFEAHVREVSERLLGEALRELGYYGFSHELAGVHIFLRDKNNFNTVEIGFNSENGEYLLRLITERHKKPQEKTQPTRIFWGNQNG